MATTISPIKILSDLGLNPWEIENDEDYLRALKEGIITIEAATKGKGDRRSEILREELIRVRKEPKKTQVKEKKSTIKGAKLLPGRGNFSADDIKPVDVEKKGDAPALMPDRLDNIANTVDSIALLLRRQFKLETKQQRDARIKQDKINKQDREDDLEKKPKDKKTGLIPNAIKKPALNFFEKLKTYFLNIMIGSGVAALFDWLKDPANAEKVTKFKDFLINNAGWIVGGLAALALLPIVGGLVGLVGGILGGLSSLGLVIPLLPIILKGILIAAVLALTVAAGNAIKNKITQAISGGSKFKELDDRAERQLREAGLGKVTNVGSGKHSAQLLGSDGKPIVVKMFGEDSLTGRKAIPGKDNANAQAELTIGNPLHEAYIERTMGKDKLEEYKSAMNLYNRVIFEEKDPIKKQMGEEIRSDKKEFVNMRRAERKELGLSWKGKRKFNNETERLWAEKENKIREKYDKIIIEKFPEYFGTVQSSANINKNTKQDTNVPGPSTKKKGDNVILDGGKGNQQASSVGGSGTGGSSGTPKIGSQDPNNYLTVSTMAMYNMVGA